MSTTRVSTIAALLVSLALPAMPARAEARGLGDGQEAQPRSGGERRRPSGGGGEGRQGGSRQGGEARQGGERRRPEASRGGNDNNQRQAEPGRQAIKGSDWLAEDAHN